MNKRPDIKRYLGILAVVLMFLFGAIIYISRDPEPAVIEAKHVAPAQSVTKASDPPAGEPVTIAGTVICLKPKSISGEQASAANCAIGLKHDEGKNYALYSKDPYISGSLPSGQRVEVNGNLTHDPSPYDVSGTINITSIKL